MAPAREAEDEPEAARRDACSMVVQEYVVLEEGLWQLAAKWKK